MRAFIVRPFGKRTTSGKTPVEIDFDRVEAELIAPALEHHGIEGRTTVEIAAQNNIRIDMFQRLVTADLVVADISIHNANVFYELGIRHALRNRHTFLLRCRGDDVPFDLRTDRYHEYDREAPGASLPRLIQAIDETLRARHADSPVFQLLPDLEPEDPSRFLPVPTGFSDRVARARAAGDAGDLELLAEETAGLPWEVPGLRLVGRAHFKLKAWESARATWESVLRLWPDDLEANTLLGTVYQRLARDARTDRDRVDLFQRSDLAVRRVLDQSGVDERARAEAFSLLGSNEKVRWRSDYTAAGPATRRETALRSPHLENAWAECDRGFEQDCNHYYSGLNALALLTVQLELAGAYPLVWAERFEEEAEAPLDLQRRASVREKLAAAVEWSLRAADGRARREEKPDIWIDISRAELRLLTSNRPSAVADAFRKALARASPFEVEAEARQLDLYDELGTLAENVAAARAVIAAIPSRPQPAIQPPRVLLFTGHRIDAPDRPKPRFPASKEGVARAAIERIVKEEIELAGGSDVIGIAGAASGGDILFHEVCFALGTPARLYLAIPQDDYQVASVQDAGPAWVERFRAICQRVPPRVLQDGPELPDWLRDRKDYSVWQRNNLWMLHHALAIGGGSNVTLIALWDGESTGDGPGGSADMVRKAEARGARKRHLETTTLFAGD
ncbi:MAG: hypothetical protein L0271_12790 [Gemmatimonadetes bacterium]|nr:hypothetical protein [Gemmatimonadota bacterium]